MGVQNPAASYDLQWRAGTQGPWTDVEDLDMAEYELTGLSTNTQYQFRVRSTNLAGDSDWSAPLTFSTLQFAPNSPTMFASTPANESFVATWVAGAADPTHGLATSYDFQWRASGTGAPWPAELNVSQTRTEVQGLARSTAYEWRVRARNSGGVSAWSNAQAVTTTDVDVPNAPTDVRLALANPTQISVRFDEPTVDASHDAATGYRIRWRAGTTGDYTVDVTTFTALMMNLVTLTPGATYQISVAAVNGAGMSAWTAPVSITFAVPGVPTALTTTAITGDGWTAGWTAPAASNTAAAAVSYDLEWRAGTTGDWTEIDNIISTSRVITGATSGTAHQWRVRAQNPVGVSAWSATQSVTTSTEQTPNVPVASAATNIEETSFTMNWAASVVDGTHDAARSYEIEWRAGTTGAFTPVTGITMTNYTLTGLTAGTSYQWRVRARNGGGASAYGLAQTASTTIIVGMPSHFRLNSLNPRRGSFVLGTNAAGAERASSSLAAESVSSPYEFTSRTLFRSIRGSGATKRTSPYASTSSFSSAMALSPSISVEIRNQTSDGLEFRYSGAGAASVNRARFRGRALTTQPNIWNVASNPEGAYPALPISFITNVVEQFSLYAQGSQSSSVVMPFIMTLGNGELECWAKGKTEGRVTLECDVGPTGSSYQFRYKSAATAASIAGIPWIEVSSATNSTSVVTASGADTSLIAQARVAGGQWGKTYYNGNSDFFLGYSGSPPVLVPAVVASSPHYILQVPNVPPVRSDFIGIDIEYRTSRSNVWVRTTASTFSRTPATASSQKLPDIEQGVTLEARACMSDNGFRLSAWSPIVTLTPP